MVSPSLVIRRVVVEGDLSCDLRFDYGINIIQAVPTGGDNRLTNSAGKTGLVELIQHGLGKNNESLAKWHFKPIINEVKTLWLEVEAKGEIFTIERSLQHITAAASVRQGPYVPGMEKFPREIVPIDQMSSLLLNALGIPEVSVRKLSGELDPLSFPLLMRAFILHQDDSFGGILNRVIPETRKADVIGFLSGITPLARFALEREASEIQIEVQQQENHFQSVRKFLEENGVPSLIEAETQVRDAEAGLRYAREAQLRIQQDIGRQANAKSDSKDVGRIDSLRSQLLGIKEEASLIERDLIGHWQEKERLEEVLASLQSDRRKARRLHVSSTILSSIEFSLCPRCLQDITPEMRMREQYARCSLCNRPITTTSDAPPKAMPRTEDIDLQIDEAETVLQDIQKETETLQERLQAIRDQEAEIGSYLEAEVQAYVSPSVDLLLARSYEVAQREADSARAQTLFNQAQALGDLEAKLNQLRLKQTSLEERLKEARKPNKERLEELRQIYEHILKAVEFPDFRDCSINPNSLLPNINGSLYSSTGSAYKALATICYHLALLELARRENTYFPLLLVIDSPAVADMNEESEDNLLRYLASLQSRMEEEFRDNNKQPDWQIILTTRRIIEELEPFVKLEISNAPNRKLLRERGRLSQLKLSELI